MDSTFRLPEELPDLPRRDSSVCQEPVERTGALLARCSVCAQMRVSHQCKEGGQLRVDRPEKFVVVHRFSLVSGHDDERTGVDAVTGEELRRLIFR